MEGNDKILVDKWLEPILSWEKDNTNVEALKDGWVVVGTAVMDGDGDGICIYVRDEGEKIAMSDDGYFINDYRPLFDNSPKEEKEKLERAIRIASHYGVRCEGSELCMDTTQERYALDFHIFLRVLAWFADYLE